MRRQHTGRPRGAILPDTWAAAHRTAAATTHTAACTIRHPGGTPGPFDPETGQRPTTPHPPHYTGPCSALQEPAGEQTPDTADETVPTVDYLVSIGWDAAPEVIVGDLVTITDPGPHGDPTLTGRTLLVDAIGRDSLSWERVLACSENQS